MNVRRLMILFLAAAHLMMWRHRFILDRWVWELRRRCVDESVDVAVLPRCWIQIAKASSANAVVTRSAQGAATEHQLASLCNVDATSSAMACICP
jgi:hypothetical protein